MVYLLYISFFWLEVHIFRLEIVVNRFIILSSKITSVKGFRIEKVIWRESFV